MKIVGLAYVAFLLLSLAGNRLRNIPLQLVGDLIARSAFALDALGVLIVLAGLAWLIAVVPGVPTWSTLAIVLLGIVAEVALALWLLIAPEQ